MPLSPTTAPLDKLPKLAVAEPNDDASSAGADDLRTSGRSGNHVLVESPDLSAYGSTALLWERADRDLAHLLYQLAGCQQGKASSSSLTHCTTDTPISLCPRQYSLQQQDYDLVEAHPRLARGISVAQSTTPRAHLLRTSPRPTRRHAILIDRLRSRSLPYLPRPISAVPETEIEHR